MKTKKYLKMVFADRIEKTPLDQLRIGKLKKKQWYFTIYITYNPDNWNVFPNIREIYGNLRTSKTLRKIFAKHNLIGYKRQPSHLKRLSFSSNFSAIQTNFQNNKMWKKLLFCDYIIECGLFKLRNLHQPFILKSNFNCKIPYILYVIIYSGSNKENIEHSRGQHTERLGIYRKHIWQPEYEKILFLKKGLHLFGHHFDTSLRRRNIKIKLKNIHLI